MQITTCSDASGRSVTFSDKKFLATSFAGLLPIAHIARSLGLFKNAKEVISAAVPCKCNTLYSPELMFEQRLLALAAGYEDLNDHDDLFHDPGFTSALGTANMASSATLCRFENGFDRHSINALNETLLSAFIDADRRLGLLPRIRRKKYRCLFLDVDSTYIKLYGHAVGTGNHLMIVFEILKPILMFEINRSKRHNMQSLVLVLFNPSLEDFQLSVVCVAFEVKFETAIRVWPVFMLKAVPNDLLIALAHFGSHAPAAFVPTGRTTAKRDAV